MKQFLGLCLCGLLLFQGCGEKTQSKQSSSSMIEEKSNNLHTSANNTTLPIDNITSISGLLWHSNIQMAFELAQKEKKDVIVMVGEESCRWCKKMKERTLTDTRIQEKMKEYILVSIKRSDKSSVVYVPEFDGNIPSFFFMKSNKELIEPVVGYFKADDFLEYINGIEE